MALMGSEIAAFEPFRGDHCESVATGSLLKGLGIHLSEPMLFGLGEGLSFIFVNLSSLPLPFVGGRVKPFALTEALCRNLKLDLKVSETASRSRAWMHLEMPLRGGRPVGLQLDSYYLDYFSKPVHFAGHCVAAHGFDDRNVFLVDTLQQGGLQRVSRQSVEVARFATGPMSARARSWTIAGGDSRPDVAKAIRLAIHANAKAYLAPPFKGASHLGIEKLQKSLPTWLEIATDPSMDLALASLLMERAGTGGSLFRNFYRDFLGEAATELPGEAVRIGKAQSMFGDSAQLWADVAAKLEDSGTAGSKAPLQEAAAHCGRIRDLEVSAMQLLAGIK
jgi:Butirosin biosynthesis protein H, N-terminal/Domain of unknown function (DUF4872)